MSSTSMSHTHMADTDLTKVPTGWSRAALLSGPGECGTVGADG
ncbi:MAG: hypothetical protein Q8N47_05890 [Bryobacterales bacterium]|nr:hypothetical protein [Bryobacterales bacterium]